MIAQSKDSLACVSIIAISLTLKHGPQNFMPPIADWFFWALFSALFAAVTAIFTKVGLEGVNSDFATLIPTFVIMTVLTGYVCLSGNWSNPFVLRPKTLFFLALSGIATGASWICYFRALKIGEAAKVVPVDKLSLILVVIFAFVFLGERPSIREWLGIFLVVFGVTALGWKS